MTFWVRGGSHAPLQAALGRCFTAHDEGGHAETAKHRAVNAQRRCLRRPSRQRPATQHTTQAVLQRLASAAATSVRGCAMACKDRDADG